MENLYEILECTMDSTEEDIRKNYQRLALEFHPDKTVEGNKIKRFIEIDKAWKVLRDKATRDLYNAQLKMSSVNNDPLLFGTYTVDELIKSEEGYYYYICRCGGSYLINEEDLNNLECNCLIECDQCSLSICVSNKK